MKCNQRFFGQEHLEEGTPERTWVERLRKYKPSMGQWGFARRDRLPELPTEGGGVAQVKYNGMLSVVMWDASRRSFVAWSPRGRCYYSLGANRTHPVTEYLNGRADELNRMTFFGETHVVRTAAGRSYMTSFNRSMSIIKNPRTRADVERIRFAVFDYRVGRDAATLTSDEPRYLDRFARLQDRFGFPVGVDAGVVHVPDHTMVADSFERSRQALQAFWDEQIGERGFEGLVLHTREERGYKVKYRDTLDVAILAFRIGRSGCRCPACEARFDLIRLIQLVKAGRLVRPDWFDDERRQTRTVVPGDACPLCGTSTVPAAGLVLGAKIALMTADGRFVDVADGAQLSVKSPLLWQIEPLYEADGYLWVRPQIVIEVSYQDLYVDRMRPVYQFDGARYDHVGDMNAVCLRPYFAGVRDDKAVNPADLRLEQVSHLVNRVHRIEAITA